jgi:hypothetical protein
MQNKIVTIFCLFGILLMLSSCATKKMFSSKYYYHNEKALTDIEQSYKSLNDQKPFSIGFTDKSFHYISLEIITDTIKYIYEFEVTEPRLQDTLHKYQLPIQGIIELVKKMQLLQCIWINKLNYYDNNQKRSLIFMSIRKAVFQLPFTTEKYYILTFYPQPQYYDSVGNLLSKRQLQKIRKINGDTFRRINDKVAYTVSNKFR